MTRNRSGSIRPRGTGAILKLLATVSGCCLGVLFSGLAPAIQHTHGEHCLVAAMDARDENHLAAAMAALEEEGAEATYRIVIQYNVLRRGDGSGGFTQLGLIDEHLRHVNWGFRDTPFVFVRMPGVRYIDDDNYYQLDSPFEAHDMYREYHTPGIANIYFHEPQLFSNPNARAYTSHSFGFRGHTYGDTRIGLPGNVAYSPHELGHLLYLLHPYESGYAGTECVARTNCSTAGDLVCDTPASPVVFGSNTLRTGEYFGNSLGPCAGDGPYAPLTDLWMEAGWNYGDPAALIRNRFTEGQVARMVATVESISADLVGPNRPEVLVDCDSDGLDDIEEILAGEEADINEDKVPDRCQKFLRNGDLVVSGMHDGDTNAVRFFDRESGAFRESMRSGAWWAHQIRQGPDGLLYLTSVQVIQQIDPATGYVVKNLVDGGPQNAGTFVDVLFDAEGELLVLDNLRRDIKRYSRDSGAFLGVFANTGLSSPKYMEYGPDGQIYVVGNGGGDGRVVRIDAQTGAVLGDFVAPGEELTSGQGLVFHDDGHLYVSEGSGSRILRFEATSGAFKDEFVSGASNGGLSNPHSLRFGPDGHLYVASRGTNSVKRFHGSSGAYLGDFVASGSGGVPGTGGLQAPAGLWFAQVAPQQFINAGLNDTWYNPQTSGQGFFLIVFEEIQSVFMAWFTYDSVATDGSANLGDAGHRWLTALGKYSGNEATLEVVSTSGGLFETPTEVERTVVGTLNLKMDSCASGTVSYDLTQIGLQGVIPIQRIVGDLIPECEALAVSSESPVQNPEDPSGEFEINWGVNDAWYQPATSGQGFFFITWPQIKKMFLSWFTYDTESTMGEARLGDPSHRWMTAQGDYTGNLADLDLFVTSGGLFDASDPSPSTEPDGNVRVEFANCHEAVVEYDIDSLGRQGRIELQRIASANAPRCEAMRAMEQ